MTPPAFHSPNSLTSVGQVLMDVVFAVSLVFVLAMVLLTMVAAKIRGVS